MDGCRRRHLRQPRAWIGLLVVAGLALASVVGLRPASSQSSTTPTKVRICHSTARNNANPLSDTNPYVSNEPAIGNNGDLQGGHLNHTGPLFPAAGWGDIIPPYAYVDQNGVTQEFPGYNWSPEGQAIWQNGCAPGKDPLTPILECVDAGPGGGFLAHFGYDNPNADPVVAPFENSFSPDPADRGQPTVFQPGRIKDAFQVASDGAPLTWTLTGTPVTASASSPACQGSITVVKVLHPSDDPGRFNLEIGGATAGGAKAVGDGGTTGTIAVRAGTHTVGESAAPGTSLGDYVTQIVCVSGGTVVAQGSTATVTVPVQKDADVVCTITNTRKSGLKAVVPVLECVVFRNGTPDQAVWGYQNDNGFAVTIPVGSTNGFMPAPSDRGQPVVFEPGRWTGVFQTPFNGATTLTWALAGQTVSASSGSDRCTASIELRKVLAPAGDPGLFNLELNGQVLATGGNGTIAGPYTVGVGEGTVSETAAPGTNLADYETTIVCTRNGTTEVSITGTKVDGAVANGDFVVCTFTNVRMTVPPTPEPPEPPLPEPPTTQPPDPPVAPIPPTPPQPVDLAITKTAKPATVLVGQKITWTVTVSNKSSVEASDVNVVKVSDISYRTKLISITPSQGTCTTTECSLGRIAPGGSATITAVTLATRIGEILNVVRVGSEEQESDYLNNTASALARVIGPFRPPAQTAVCRTLGAAPSALHAGSTSIVLTTARNRFGAPVPNVTVHLLGLGLDQRAKTDARGIARFTITPPTSGLVYFRGSLRTPQAAGPVCATLLAVLSAKPGSVTG